MVGPRARNDVCLAFGKESTSCNCACIFVHVFLQLRREREGRRGVRGMVDKWWVEMYSCMNMRQAMFHVLWHTSRMMCGRTACAQGCMCGT